MGQVSTFTFYFPPSPVSVSIPAFGRGCFRTLERDGGSQGRRIRGGSRSEWEGRAVDTNTAVAYLPT